MELLLRLLRMAPGLFCQCGCARCAKYDHCHSRRCLQ